MNESKWRFFEKMGNYRVQDLGRPAIFLIPVGKLQQKIGRLTIEEYLETFLKKHFRAFTRSQAYIRGYWEGHVDDLVEFEVSFLGKENIPLLLHELAFIARKMGEACIYIKAGQYTGLVFPKIQKKIYKKSP